MWPFHKKPDRQDAQARRTIEQVRQEQTALHTKIEDVRRGTIRLQVMAEALELKARY